MNSDDLNNFLGTPITLANLELIVVEVPQKSVFKSAIGERKSRTALIIKWTDRDGDVGWGECSCRPDPFYSHEFVNGAIEVLQSYIFPLIAKVNNYGGLINELKKIRGWNFTKAAVEFAANDLIRRKTGTGILEASGLKSIEKVPVGISLGLFESTAALKSKLQEVQIFGYRRLKFKVAKHYINQELLNEFGQLDHDNIAFDANGAFDSSSFDELDKIASLNHIIEQPYAPTNLYLHQEYIRSYKDFKICLDEEVESYGDLVSNSLEMQQLNIKPGRVGGLWTSIQMIKYCAEHGIDAWIGGMFETSIGRALNLQVASLLPNAKAHDLSPSSRYFERDLVVKPIEMAEGFISNDYFNQIEVDHKAINDLILQSIKLEN